MDLTRESNFSESSDTSGLLSSLLFKASLMPFDALFRIGLVSITIDGDEKESDLEKDFLLEEA
jgi:hypothetical protein